MKINRYKYLGNGKYKIKIEDSEYIIYEDIILKYRILTKEEITKEELEKYIKDNTFYDAYYKAAKYIKVKLRSEKEIATYLTKNNFSSKIIEKIIIKLKKEGYINENIYTEAYINDQINLKNSGPLKIEKELENLGIEKTIITKHLKKYTKEEQFTKIKKIIEKEIKLNHSKSTIMLKNKILTSLLNKGFYKEDIIEILETIDIDDKEIYEKEYKKIYEKYSKKYKGKELEYKIKEKMYQKGFRI